MKRCDYCDLPLPNETGKARYCSTWHETLAEIRDVGEDNSRRREEERDADREFEVVRVALKTMATDTRFEALAQMAMHSLDTLQRGAR